MGIVDCAGLHLWARGFGGPDSLRSGAVVLLEGTTREAPSGCLNRLFEAALVWLGLGVRVAGPPVEHKPTGDSDEPQPVGLEDEVMRRMS